MFRSLKDEIALLLYQFVHMQEQGMNNREKHIAFIAYHLGRKIREDEILYNRKLFKDEDEQEDKK